MHHTPLGICPCLTGKLILLTPEYPGFGYKTMSVPMQLSATLPTKYLHWVRYIPSRRGYEPLSTVIYSLSFYQPLRIHTARYVARSFIHRKEGCCKTLCMSWMAIDKSQMMISGMRFGVLCTTSEKRLCIDRQDLSVSQPSRPPHSIETSHSRTKHSPSARGRLRCKNSSTQGSRQRGWSRIYTIIANIGIRALFYESRRPPMLRARQ
ncbi:hypothetical protein F5Y14DRAFT_421432 [Nemania sp. NC0429]|nr:hypothetical protein F5Y14DRAFT_421432 [Nemania sp. NC0429]